ncbi:MAG: cytochrome P450 [Pseudomonadota bacterium]
MLTLDAFTPQAEVYETYAAWQDAGPVHRSDAFAGGAWLLPRYDDVAQALKDPRLSARRTGGWVNQAAADGGAGALAPFQRLFARALLFLDVPEHSRLRQILAPGFRPAAWQALTAQVTADVEAALDQLPPGAPFDFMEHIAKPIPARVVARLMGLENVSGDFVTWSDDIAAFLGHPAPNLALGQRAQRSALALAAMFHRVLTERRRSPCAAPADWTALLLEAERQGQVHSLEELLAQCVMLLFAGHETTRHLLGNGLHALLCQPGAWAQLQQAPEQLPSAVREMLRYDSPVQFSGRRVAETFTLHGQVLTRGDLVIPLIGAANRDPRVYSEPHRLRLDRKEAAHLSFGTGPHVCIGAALTYLEAQAVFATLLRRWPTPPHMATAPQRGTNPLYRGFEHLMLTLT